MSSGATATVNGVGANGVTRINTNGVIKSDVNGVTRADVNGVSKIEVNGITKSDVNGINNVNGVSKNDVNGINKTDNKGAKKNDVNGVTKCDVNGVSKNDVNGVKKKNEGSPESKKSGDSTSSAEVTPKKTPPGAGFGAIIRGSDPRVATCRGKLQSKRSKLNQEINKELRLRAGAENLFKATTNRKLRETVALELSFVNSNLQLLKEQLAELNGSVELYQSDSTQPCMPMVPLGLKETKEIDFRDPFKDFILEHYSEDGSRYEDAVAELMDVRQAARTPRRDAAGVALLCQYYNQLYFVERRFFPPDRSLGIYFEWYDSLTGVPSCQRTVAFEKACVLFNMGAVYTQIGAKQERSSPRGLDAAVDAFLRAAGVFQYIHENFTNAPSMDLGPAMLGMLVQLMLAQARECLLEKLELQAPTPRSFDAFLDLAQEAAQVSEVYGQVAAAIAGAPAVRDYAPHSWAALVAVKREHFAARAHAHAAAAVGSAPAVAPASRRGAALRDALLLLHAEPDARTAATQLDVRAPTDAAERALLGRAHLREALLRHEESQRLQRMSRELKGKSALANVLRTAHQRALDSYTAAEREDDFRELLDPPRVQPSTKFQLSLTPPDFGAHRVEDLFRALGPVAIFSAKHHWTAPRSVQLQRAAADGFGFSVRGDAPVIVAGVDQGSLADFGGMKEGDFIVAIGDQDVKWASHEEVVNLIKEAGDSLSLKLVTPMDRNYLKQPKGGPKGSVSNSSSSSGISSGQPSPAGTVAGLHPHKKLTWNPFKKAGSPRDTNKDNSFDSNVILR